MSYTAMEMNHSGFPVSFSLEESEQFCTIANDIRMTPNVHVIRSKYTTAQIRDVNKAQQNPKGTDRGGLFGIVLDSLANEKSHVAALILDSHVDGGLVTGHAALGGGNGTVSLAIFGSHTLFSWPSGITDLERCFTDSRAVDTRFCAVDGEGRRYFSACNVGVGAMMHEVGHLFGCPHQESGVMMRDYVRLHRSLTAVEPEFGGDVGTGECHWHRLDILRFAGHPSFGPQEPGPISAMATFDGLEVRCDAGIRVIEFYDSGEFPVDYQEIGATTAFIKMRGQRMNCIGNNMSSISLQSADLAPKIINGLRTLSSPTLGSNPGDLQKFLIPPSVKRVVIYSGSCLDGVEFDGLLLGHRGGSPHTYTLEQGEYLIGFIVRSGLWIDALGIITNLRNGEIHGGGGGSEYHLRCPRGYRVCGVSGERGQWLNKFAMIYTSM